MDVSTSTTFDLIHIFSRIEDGRYNQYSPTLLRLTVFPIRLLSICKKKTLINRLDYENIARFVDKFRRLSNANILFHFYLRLSIFPRHDLYRMRSRWTPIFHLDFHIFQVQLGQPPKCSVV